MISVLSDIRDWTLYTATGLGGVMFWYYTQVAKWWERPEGRFLMAWMTWGWIILVFLTFRISTVINVTGGVIVGLLIYLWFAVNAVWAIRLISDVQWRNLKDKAVRLIVSRKESDSER